MLNKQPLLHFFLKFVGIPRLWLISGRIGTSLFTAGPEGLCNRRTPGFISHCWFGRGLNDQTEMQQMCEVCLSVCFFFRNLETMSVVLRWISHFAECLRA